MDVPGCRVAFPPLVESNSAAEVGKKDEGSNSSHVTGDRVRERRIKDGEEDEVACFEMLGCLFVYYNHKTSPASLPA